MIRAPRAVTHFSPGSYASRPTQVTGLDNLFLAGDWVKGVPHGANGLSQVPHAFTYNCLSDERLDEEHPTFRKQPLPRTCAFDLNFTVHDGRLD